MEVLKMNLYYEEIYIGYIATNQNLTIEEGLCLIDFNEEEFLQENCFDDIDYNEFYFA